MKDNLVYKYETESYIFTHAGLEPEKGLKEQNIDDYLLSYSDSPYIQTDKTVVHGHIHGYEITFIRVVGFSQFVYRACRDKPYFSAHFDKLNERVP